jgi:hypothetical protein
LRLAELCLFADGIAAGTLRSIDETGFVVGTDWMLTDREVPTDLRVKRFVDWTCAQRWTEYRPGQRVLLFLAHDAGSDPSWSILGGGGEGEMPMLGDRVVLRGFRLAGVESDEHDVGGASVQGPLVDLAELRTAISHLRSACRVEPRGPDGEGPFLRAVGSSGEGIDACLEGSSLERHLALDALSSDSWRGWSTDAPILLREDVVRLVSAAQLGVERPANPRSRRNSSARSGFGASAAVIGDVNGDGSDDLAVGAPDDGHRPGCSGALWILFLAPDGEVLARQEIGALDLQLGERARFATSVAAAGDLDADGVPDLAVGTPYWKEGDRFAGCIWTLLLREDGTVKEAIVVAGGPGVQESAPLPGTSLSMLGDLDSDGFPELVAGLHHSHVPALGRNDALIEIASLARGGSATRSRSILHSELAVGQSFCALGQAVCGVGDIDGDRVPDLAVADPAHSEAADYRGAVWILLLGDDGAVRAKTCISAWSGGFNGLIRNRGEFGSALAGPGDVDGDGTPDLLVGSADGLWLLSLRPDGSVGGHRLYRGLGLAGARKRAPTSIAASRSRESPEEVRVVLGGTIPSDEGDESYLWLCNLARDGSVARWR